MKCDYEYMTKIELMTELDHLHELRNDIINDSITNDIDNLDKLASAVLTIDDAIAKVEAAFAKSSK